MAPPSASPTARTGHGVCGCYGFRFVNGRACSIPRLPLGNRLHAYHLSSLYNVLRHQSRHPRRGRAHRALFPLQGSLAGAARRCRRIRGAPAMAAAAQAGRATKAPRRMGGDGARGRWPATPVVESPSIAADWRNETSPEARLAVGRRGRHARGGRAAETAVLVRKLFRLPPLATHRAAANFAARHGLRRDGRAGAGAGDLAHRRGAPAAANRRLLQDGRARGESARAVPSRTSRSPPRRWTASRCWSSRA